MMEKQYWQIKLTAFDAELVKMVESLTGKPCEPKNGGNHFFFEADYEKHNDPQYILADLVRTDVLPIYRKLGRDGFLHFCKANPDCWTLKQVKERLKQWQQKTNH